MAPLKISIPSAQTKTPESGKPYTEYTIKIDHPFPRSTSSVAKRYTDFANLDSALRSVVAAPPAALPPKSWSLFGIGSSLGSPEQVEKRRQGLEAYLRAIENSEDARWKTCQVYRQFLGLDDKEGRRAAAGFPGSQFGKDRVRDSSDWLDKHAEVKSSLQDARRWLTAREQATAASAQHDAAANAKRALLRAEALLAALEEGLRRLSGTSGDEWSGEKLGDGEVRRRKDMIGSARKERDGLESVLNTLAAKAALSGSGTLSSPSTSSAAVTAEQKAGLFKGASKAPSGRRVLGGAPVETERTRELDNEGVLQLQQQIIQEQDQDLVDLTTVVKRMREMGVAINEEVVQQNALLGLFEEDVQRVDGKIRIAKKRIEKIR